MPGLYSNDNQDIGNMARFMRSWLNIQQCQQYPWPTALWSPGVTPGSTARERARARAIGYQYSVIMPMSYIGVGNCANSGGTYGTQVMYLREATYGIYSYRTHQMTNWLTINLKALKGTKKTIQYPLGPLMDQSFGIDVTAGKLPSKCVHAAGAARRWRREIVVTRQSEGSKR